jgi:hypothetical protein
MVACRLVGLKDPLYTHCGNGKVEWWKPSDTKLFGDARINPRPVNKPIAHLGLTATADAADNRLTFRR